MKKIYISNLAHYHPDGVIDNKKFEETLETTAQWIEDKVGISERRFMPDYQDLMPVYEITRRVFKAFLEKAPSALKDIDLIISCGTHDDLHYPNPGNLISEEFGISAPTFQIKVACTSAAYALSIASAFIKSSQATKVLILNGEPFTRFIDYGDRSSSILFGDGATAFIVSGEPGDFELINIELGSKGMKIVEASRTSETSHFTPSEFSTGQISPSKPIYNRRRNSDKKFQQDGKAVVEFVLSNMPSKINSFLDASKFDKKSVDYFICHQSNMSMMNKLFDELKFPRAKHLHNIKHFGNTGSSGWISVLSQNQESIQSDQVIFATVFGAGMTWANLLLKKA